MRTVYAHRGWRLLAVVILQVALMLALWKLIVPGVVHYGGVLGALIWVGGCFVAACRMDGRPWGAGLAFALVGTAIFGGFIGALWLWPDWRGFVIGMPFLALGYRLANVIDRRTADTIRHPASIINGLG